MNKLIRIASFAVVGASLIGGSPVANASPHSGGSETIKVSKAEYAPTGSYVELLIKASSSNTQAHLYAYLPTGALLGEIRNGGGQRYGGSVFVTPTIPSTITIKSSAGAQVTVKTTLFQP